MIRIGLPKGNVKQKSLSLIKAYLGIEQDSDKLSFSDNKNIHFYLLKHRDIPKLIEQGDLEIGITSSEWINEAGLCLHIIKKLDWCDTRISLISERGKRILLEEEPIRCITEFPFTAKSFFKQENIKNVQIERISGSSEALIPSLYNCCIDCVETGKTLKLHNLTEEKVIYASSIVLVKRKEINFEAEKIVKKIIELVDKL